MREERIRRKELGLKPLKDPNRVKRIKRPSGAAPIHVERMIEKWKLTAFDSIATRR